MSIRRALAHFESELEKERRALHFVGERLSEAEAQRRRERSRDQLEGEVAADRGAVPRRVWGIAAVADLEPWPGPDSELELLCVDDARRDAFADRERVDLLHLVVTLCPLE